MDDPFNNAPFAAELVGEAPSPLGGRDPRYDNQPPLEERVMMELMEALQAPRGDKLSIAQRIEQIVDSAGRIPETIEDEETCGKVADLVRIAGAAAKEVEAAREGLNRPLLTAQRSLKAKADSVLAPMNSAVAVARRKLDDFVARQEAKRRAEARERELEAQRAREALERENIAPEVIEQVTAAPKVEKGPLVRSDYGSAVSSRTVWKHEIESVRQVPDRFLKHPKVVDALNLVIGQAVRGGEREIKGVRVWCEQAASVR